MKNRKKFQLRLDNLNSEWNAKLKELEDEEKKEVEEFNAKVEQLHKRGT